MKTLKLAVVLTAALPLAAAAQDAVKVAPQHYKVLIDNASVRVLKITYSPGAKSAMHSHPDAMLVALQDSKTRFTLPDGKTQDIDIGKETATYMTASSHAPTNIGTTPVDAILVEFKSKEPGTASVPTSRPGVQLNVARGEPACDRVQDDRGARLPRGRRDHARVRPGRDLARGQRPVARGRRQAGRDQVAARHRAVHRPRRQARIEERQRPAGRVRDRRDKVNARGGRPPTDRRASLRGARPRGV